MSQEQLKELCRVVDQKVTEYKRKYGKPNYIKLPEWIYRESLLTLTMMFVNTKHDILYVFGLIACPTVSIERLDEIEVF